MTLSVAIEVLTGRLGEPTTAAVKTGNAILRKSSLTGHHRPMV
jgi:hypothetical protein